LSRPRTQKVPRGGGGEERGAEKGSAQKSEIFKKSKKGNDYKQGNFQNPPMRQKTIQIPETRKGDNKTRRLFKSQEPKL